LTLCLGTEINHIYKKKVAAFANSCFLSDTMKVLITMNVECQPDGNEEILFKILKFLHHSKTKLPGMVYFRFSFFNWKKRYERCPGEA
jgi:hypothetical protein